MFGLSQIPALLHLHFVSAEPGKAFINYIEPAVKQLLIQRTKRIKRYIWLPTEFENLYSRIYWKKQTLRVFNTNLPERECLRQFLIVRYVAMFKL